MITKKNIKENLALIILIVVTVLFITYAFYTKNQLQILAKNTCIQAGYNDYVPYIRGAYRTTIEDVADFKNRIVTCIDQDNNLKYVKY